MNRRTLEFSDSREMHGKGFKSGKIHHLKKKKTPVDERTNRPEKGTKG